MVHRRDFLASTMAAAAAVSLPGVASGAIRRFGNTRPAKNAEHGVVYRNDGEFCAWPYHAGILRNRPTASLIANFIRTHGELRQCRQPQPQCGDARGLHAGLRPLA